MEKYVYKSLCSTPLRASVYLKFEPSFIGQSEGSILNLLFLAQDGKTLFRKLSKWKNSSAKICPLGWPGYVFGISTPAISNPAQDVELIVKCLASHGIVVKFQSNDSVE
jgi:hypothetical protein